jgi:glutamyl-tRNA reductase
MQRESFVLTPESLAKALPVAQKKHQLQELFILSTCNRFEVIGTQEARTPSHQELIQLWLDLHQEAGGTNTLDAEELGQITYHLSDQDVIKHAFRVASSLDSLIPGETQITGQFRDAVALATNAKTMGPVLQRMSQEAIATAKRVRSQTSIGRRTVSIGHAAVGLAKRMFSDLSQCRFLILGAGEMARTAVEHAKSFHPKQIIIANRTAARAVELSQHLGINHGFGLDDLPALVAQSDVVIAATSAQSTILGPTHLEKALNLRNPKKPLFLVDISLPRNIDPLCATFENTYLFDIDDLKQVVDKNIHLRQEAADEASTIIEESVLAFNKWLEMQILSPTLSAWRDHVFTTLERELQKTTSKDLFSSLNSKQMSALRSMIDAVTSRLAADLASGLKRRSAQEAAHLSSELMRCFNLSESDTTTSNKEDFS